MKIARVIITFKCLRKCAGCCNTYKSIMSVAKLLDDITTLKDYDIVMITGGEPMLMPDRVIDLSKQLRSVSKCKIYLYTAYHKKLEDLVSVLHYVDGIQYSLHAEATPYDIDDFHSFQNSISGYINKSFRLFIDNRIIHFVKILPMLWKRVEIKHWLTEEELLNKQTNGLPAGEELFILTQKG